MERLMSGDFDVKAKHSSEEALQKWRKLCGVVKNPKRRFRFTANLSKRYEAAAMRKTNQEKLRIAVLVSKAAFQFIQGVSPSDYNVPAEVKAAGFDICADELGSIVESHDVKKLNFHGGVTGVSQKLCTSVIDGLTTADSDLLNRRQEIYGINKFAESQPRSFWVFVWEALQDMTLMILGVCAFVSLIVGIATEGWLEGAHDGLGIVASILLVVFVTATSDYRQSLQFRDLDTEKKKIIIQVTRNGFRQKLSIYDLLPGDIVHLSIGDQVPADGLFVSGFSVLIDESSLTGESEPVMVNSESPFMLSGTKVQDGSCKMMVATVGMRTQWGKLMATLSEGGDDETPLQVKLNGVATIIGKIGLFFAVVTFTVLVVDQPTNAASLVSEMPVSAVKLLLQSIFNNTGGEVAVNKDGKREILGTPTETALLEFGLSLNGDFQEERQAVKLVKVEPFNSTKKRMGVVLELHEGGLRAHTKGASEIVLAACDKVINSNGDIVPLDEESINLLNGTIDQFASEALRTLCLAYMELEGGFSPENPMPVSAIEGPDFREKSLEELLQLVPKIQIFNEISSREMEEIDVFKGILDNYVFVVVIGGTVLSQIIIVEFLGTFANTTPLTFAQWFLSVLIGFLGMPIAAGLKKIPPARASSQVEFTILSSSSAQLTDKLMLPLCDAV
ncbi:CALCIUM-TRANSPORTING ATPASE 2 PLASMA MEMBRANE-TYPE [Salix purpurea]|uniref:CALCIUM-TRANSPORTING ATPASE 2 PLASMA MEMBRANE-TYPE n=1 Tax=Salix purpurea TaxID=77065 RepID=A0A9Q0V3C6_SALPP|nr:CALCIUM-TRANSPORTING ATPASE 2 PLASMA MEMBRANE-TYPE [Salix purpurea]